MPIVLLIMLLVGCGSSPEVSDIEANQVEEAPISEEKEDIQTEPFEDEMATTC